MAATTGAGFFCSGVGVGFAAGVDAKTELQFTAFQSTFFRSYATSSHLTSFMSRLELQTVSKGIDMVALGEYLRCLTARMEAGVAVVQGGGLADSEGAEHHSRCALHVGGV